MWRLLFDSVIRVQNTHLAEYKNALFCLSQWPTPLQAKPLASKTKKKMMLAYYGFRRKDITAKKDKFVNNLSIIVVEIIKCTYLKNFEQNSKSLEGPDAFWTLRMTWHAHRRFFLWDNECEWHREETFILLVVTYNFSSICRG